MKVLIQQASIIDPSSPFNGKIQDILIENGKIKEIADHLDISADKIIQGKNLHVSTGWVDIFAQMGDPGYEYKETLETGAAAAAAGGFLHVAIIPNTKPSIDNKTQVEYIKNKSAHLPVNIYPLGAVTQKTEGKDLAEMYDMHNAGAIGFTDGTHPIQSAGLLVKALQYVKAIDSLIISIPDDNTIGTHGQMHEGVVSTRLGFPGKPIIAEEIAVARDIKLARYAESKLHFTGVTSPKSLEYIRRAKESGASITCSVTPYHLYFNEEVLVNYDSNTKVFPPLRPQSMVDELKKSLLDGTIDCITTHHQPHEYDSKVLEFEYAKPGMIGLETAFSVIRTAVPELSMERLVYLISTRPAELLKIQLPNIQVGAEASLTIFDPEQEMQVTKTSLKSKSQNSPFINQTLKGKVIGIVNKSNTFLNS